MAITSGVVASTSGSAPNLDLSGPYAQLLKEVLGSIATPQVRGMLLESALREAGYEMIPVDAERFRAFALGPLRFTVAASLGDDAAEMVLDGLRPALGQTFSAPPPPAPHEEEELVLGSSGVRRRARESLPAPHSGASTVLLASPSPADALIASLTTRVKLIVVRDIFGLLQALTTHGAHQPLVLLADELPGLRAATFRTMARLLGTDGRLVLFGHGGPNPDEDTELSWFHVGALPHGDLAELALGLLSTADTEPPPAIPKVMLIEPDPAIGRALYESLARGGYEVDWVGDGFEGLERCLDGGMHAVVANLRLAGLDGGQLAQLLMQNFAEESPLVLLLADGPLPEPPEGVAAVVQRRGPASAIVDELDAWFRQ